MLDAALKQVKRDKAAFAMLVKEGERLTETGNVLAGAANLERLSADEQALEVLARGATRAGPISDALSAAARDLKAGKLGRGEAARAFLRDVQGRNLVGLERGPGAGERVAGDAGTPDRPAAAGEQGEAPDQALGPDPDQAALFQGPARVRVGQGRARYVDRPDGRYVALENGSDVLGEISPEVAAAVGREPAPIRLPEGDARSGEKHIEKQRGDDIREAGYADAADLIADVAARYSHIYAGNKNRLVLAKINGKVNFAVIELEKSAVDGQWTVITGGAFRARYLKNKKLLWEGERRSPFPADAGGPLFQRGGQSSESILTSEAAAGQAPPGEARAAVEITDDLTRIWFSEKADASSVIHESGHVFLAVLRRLARAGAQPRPAEISEWAPTSPTFKPTPLTKRAVERRGAEVPPRNRV